MRETDESRSEDSLRVLFKLSSLQELSLDPQVINHLTRSTLTAKFSTTRDTTQTLYDFIAWKFVQAHFVGNSSLASDPLLGIQISIYTTIPKQKIEADGSRKLNNVDDIGSAGRIKLEVTFDKLN